MPSGPRQDVGNRRTRTSLGDRPPFGGPRYPPELDMRLYEFPPTRSIRARWALQELGVDFEPITVNLVKGENRLPEFLRINPAGKVPVLVDGDLVLTESIAIVMYLAEKYRDKALLPTDPVQR